MVEPGETVLVGLGGKTVEKEVSAIQMTGLAPGETPMATISFYDMSEITLPLDDIEELFIDAV